MKTLFDTFSREKTYDASPTAPAQCAEQETKREKLNPGRVFLLCPVRHALLLLSMAVMGGYFCFRENRGLMDAVSAWIVRPYHRAAGRVSALFPFSLAELFYVLLILGGLFYLARAVFLLVKRGRRGRRVYITTITLLSAGAMFYAGYCLLWGVYYYAESFSERVGLASGPVDRGELAAVTGYFIETVNETAALVPRDGEGNFASEQRGIFDRSVTLYDAVVQQYPSLEGPALRAKPMLFSRFMSWINFTGFFFPFTGEANLNVDAPLALLPATISHELAHQRGVAGEDEANFVAVLAAMESGDPVYMYSAGLLAYIHLGNALHGADYDAWLLAYGTLCDEARADLRQNNEYWDRFETKAAAASEAVYTGFLQSHGQELGMQSYGACVDLLVAYYAEAAGG